MPIKRMKSETALSAPLASARKESRSRGATKQKPLRHRFENGVRSLTIFAVAGSMSTIAHAQTEEPGSADPDIEVIVVTAQQREENLQDVPISVQAFNNELLKKVAITNVEDIQYVTPGLSMGRNAAATTPFIRGIGSTSGGAGNESAVATYVDGVYRQLMYTNSVSLTDIERVEVLKGPQGTLFGRNTTGGVVHIITKDPSDELGGELNLSAGNYGILELSSYLTGGVVEDIAFSVSGYVRQQEDGFGESTFINEDILVRDEVSGRSKLQFDNGITRITLAADYADVHDDRGFSRNVLPGAIVGLPNQPATWTTYGGDWHDNQEAVAPRGVGVGNCVAPCIVPRSRRSNDKPVAGYSESIDYGASITAEHSFSRFDAVSITAWRDASTEILFDNDFGKAFLSDALIDYYTKNFTQEIRIASNNNSGTTWIGGLFYLNGDSGNYLEVPTVLTAQLRTKSYAAFAEVGFKFFDDAGTLTIGGRYTIDKRRVSGTVGGNPDFGIPGNAVPGPSVDPTTTWKEPTYRIVYSHDITPNVMAYAGYNRGFKSGNYNLIPATTASYNPEILDAFEAGFKSTLAGGRIRFNGAVFYYEYDDLQLQITDAVSARVINAAAAEIKGVEVDFNARVTDGLTVNLGATYIDAEYASFPQAQVYFPNVDPVTGQPVGGAFTTQFDASGKPLVRTPEFSGVFLASYEHDVGNGSFNASVGGHYQSGFSWEPANRLREGGYLMLNASIGYESLTGWGVRLRATNLLDKEYSIFTATNNFGDQYSAGDPRLYSVTFSLKF